MRPIVIGAGRGSRLGPETDDVPKALVPVMGRPMLEWILDALGAGRLRPQGRRLHLRLQGRRRARSLPGVHLRGERELGAQQHPGARCSALASHSRPGFVSTYADIVYRGSTVKKLVASPHDKVLACDTDWRRRYIDRTQHPETRRREDARRGRPRRRAVAPHPLGEGERGVHRRHEVHGRRRARDGGARSTRCGPARCTGKTWREGRTFERAYLIDLFQEMIERGSAFHRVDTHGGYMEIDTGEDLACAEKWWRESAPE